MDWLSAVGSSDRGEPHRPSRLAWLCSRGRGRVPGEQAKTCPGFWDLAKTGTLSLALSVSQSMTLPKYLLQGHHSFRIKWCRGESCVWEQEGLCFSASNTWFLPWWCRVRWIPTTRRTAHPHLNIEIPSKAKYRWFGSWVYGTAAFRWHCHWKATLFVKLRKPMRVEEPVM